MPEVEAGLYLRLRVDRESVTVQAAARIPRWSEKVLHAPLLTKVNVKRFASPGAETVLSMLDARGAVVASFGFAERPQVFFDRKAGEGRSALTGNTGDPKQSLREIRVPFHEAVRFLCFYRSELVFEQRDGVRTPDLRQQYEALYSTAAPGEPSLPSPPLPVPAPRTVIPAPLPWLPAREKRPE